MSYLTLHKLFVLSMLIGFIVQLPAAQAVYEKGDWPWNLKVISYHDEVINKKIGGGWFMNVGPTGIRARITHEHPAYFTVKFVFDKSPAAGKVKIGDIIVGANGKKMNVPHRFGRRTVSGWEGPMMEMAKLIEDSQGKDGKLELIIWPGGAEKNEKKVTLQLKRVGRFSSTYPYNCPRTDKLITALCDFLAQEYQREGKFVSRVHTHSACVLALMASGNRKYEPIIRKCMTGYQNKRYDSASGVGFPSWTYGYDGIVMGEYYLLTKDRSLLPTIQLLSHCMEESQTWKAGGFSHKPSPFIMRRVAGGGPKGYGAMSTPGGLVMIAQSLFRAGGAPYSKRCYERLHQAYLHSWSLDGSIGYGFNQWDHAVLELKGKSKGKAKSGKGIGYLVPSGMKEIVEYDLTWPTKADPRYRDTSWVERERDSIVVYELNEKARLAVRNMIPSEPAKPYPKTGKQIGHIARSGTGALAHFISNADNKSWLYMANHLASACANSPKSLLDGHASTLMHTLWGSLAAARADEKEFRAYMDYIKWWFIMAETHNGGFIVMPGRDYASTDHVYGNRNLPTATAALILSVKNRRLQITGAGLTGGPMITTSSRRPSGSSSTTSVSNAARTAPVSPDSPGAKVLAAIEKDGFKIKHCVKEANLLAANRSFSSVLKMLDAASGKNGDYGKEAKAFAAALGNYIARQSKEILARSQAQPAKSLADLQDYHKLIRGLDEATEIQKRVQALSMDKDIRILLLHYKQYELISKQEAARKKTPQTEAKWQQLGKALQQFTSKPGLDEAVLKEARRLLFQVKKKRAAPDDLIIRLLDP